MAFIIYPTYGQQRWNGLAASVALRPRGQFFHHLLRYGRPQPRAVLLVVYPNNTGNCEKTTVNGAV